MIRIRIKDNVDLKELEKYGFEFYDGYYQYTRIIDGIVTWKAYITKTHHNLQIIVYEPCVMARELQRLIYNLTLDGLLEDVRD